MTEPSAGAVQAAIRESVCAEIGFALTVPEAEAILAAAYAVDFPADGFFTAASLEAAVAMAKWPNEEIYHRLAALTGEVGELAEGVIKNRPDVEREAIQVAACAYRCWKTLRSASGPTAPPAEQDTPQ